MRESRLKIFFRILALSLASAETIAMRNTMGPDGRSYLEIAHAYLRHDWASAINAYWSPLHPWILALVLGVARPSWRWEYPTLHAANLLIFPVAIAAFEFFWQGIPRHESGVPNPALWILGYSLFIWLTLGLGGPDLYVVVMVYLTAGLMV